MLALGQQPREFCLGDFASDARHAIKTSPDYFVRWYTIKSVGLGVAAAALAFMIGRATVKRS